MKPFIAIVANFDTNIFKRPCSSVPFTYTNSIEKGGGTPFIVPLTTSRSAIRQVLSRADGVLFVGGMDVNPQRYGETPGEKLMSPNPELDEPQFAICEEALEMNLPLLGICRGAQVINVALGGTLVQDVPTSFPESDLDHMPEDQEKRFNICHQVSIEPGSALHSIFGDTVGVNSVHHQAIKGVGQGLRVTARATDGVIEAVEHRSHPILCVQWHPELMLTRTDDMLPLFEYFVGMCSDFSKQ